MKKMSFLFNALNPNFLSVNSKFINYYKMQMKFSDLNEFKVKF